ncbi:hypothetical protein D3P08_16695 [Paenibacillus nanensis]|uniref:GNAT family N-acetyltransferase n=1 Tax=Paenibacillus nanensis TaxID=393251 RepID=A0A3A1UYU8_9BACL|nr:hypothetical protein [Paenibacillus nanensis]RIX51543.1 hypothetical protein D3P08_16695 [Paenibacillus nanensis]
MNESFAVCASMMYQRKYIDFLLANYEALNMPYSFSVAFSFLASPILMERECFLCLNDDGEAVGAFGYIHGTGERNYEDRHIVQLQVAYLDNKHRRTTLFLRGLQYLAEHLRWLEDEVSELVFWTKPDDYTMRLFDKFAGRTSDPGTASGNLLAYRVTVSELNAYLAKFSRRVPA